METTSWDRSSSPTASLKRGFEAAGVRALPGASAAGAAISSGGHPHAQLCEHRGAGWCRHHVDTW